MNLSVPSTNHRRCKPLRRRPDVQGGEGHAVITTPCMLVDTLWVQEKFRWFPFWEFKVRIHPALVANVRWHIGLRDITALNPPHSSSQSYEEDHVEDYGIGNAVVNFIRSTSMRHRQFRYIIMSDNDTFNGDLPYHSKIRWLSRGQVLLKIFTLRQQIIKIFEEQKKYCDLSDKEF
ncbi:GTF2IRD2 [Cordylochernes scorpioides]|uniref:GTF2IRD2 n=1 Tax=Cordylochernes scorpioides TaxID=51811 RepID=A0ABY6KH99_9ARAC|nr:GTF2IRD2 [Cordylochernes scorpioides]